MFGMAFFKSLRVPRERSLSNSDCPRVGEKLTHCPIAETLPDFTSIQFTALAFLPTMRDSIDALAATPVLFLAQMRFSLAPVALQANCDERVYYD